MPVDVAENRGDLVALNKTIQIFHRNFAYYEIFTSMRKNKKEIKKSENLQNTMIPENNATNLLNEYLNRNFTE